MTTAYPSRRDLRARTPSSWRRGSAAGARLFIVLLISAALFGAGCNRLRSSAATLATSTNVTHAGVASLGGHASAAPSPTAQNSAAVAPARLPTQPKKRLPRMVHVPDRVVGGTVTLNVLAPHLHHINAHAPSWLALYKKTANMSFKRVFEVRRDAILSGAIVLPRLTSGARYRLQGTVYYCTDTAGACLMQSHDQVLIGGDDDSGSSTVDIALRMP